MMSNAACPYPACITDIIAITSQMSLKAHRCQISPMKNPPTSVGRSTPIGRNFLDRGFNFLDNPAIHALPSGFHRQAGQERAWHRSAAPGCRDLLERRQLAHHCRVHGNRGREALRSPRARESAGRRSCASGAAVVAKVDRLTRSVAFLSRLLEAGVDVRFADLPIGGFLGYYRVSTRQTSLAGRI